MSLVVDRLIIGAGISSLYLALGLQKLGQSFLLLEKSKGVGGRLATRRDGLSTYDHGAQFVKVIKDKPFALDPQWTESGLKQLWFSDEKYNYFSSQNGMTSLAKWMARELPIQFSEKVLKLEKENGLWNVVCESEEVYQCKSVFITAPVPQALDILAASGMEFPKSLTEITYAQALVGLFELEETEIFKEWTYEQNCTEFVFSVANQRSKKLGENLTFTVVMQPDFSAENFLKPEAEVLESITQYFKKIISSSAVIKKSQLKKWRYSHPTKVSQQLFFQLPQAKEIYLLGDGFGGPQIHGACKSAQAVIDFLST